MKQNEPNFLLDENSIDFSISFNHEGLNKDVKVANLKISIEMISTGDISSISEETIIDNIKLKMNKLL